MQRVYNRLQDVRTRLSEEIKATKKRINPVHHPLFNLTMQNKIDHANRILRLMDRYPNITVQETYDNRDNLERLQYLVWDAGGKAQWDD